MMELRDREILEEIKEVEKAIQDEEVKEEEEKDRLRLIYKEWVEDYCNVKFAEKDLPAGISLALDELVKVDPMSFNISSESLSDMSITYGNGASGGKNGGGIPLYILAWLEPYRRPFLVSDKRKKPYVRD